MYEVANRLDVAGRLSSSLEVAAFSDMEALAKAGASLEVHASAPAPA